MKRKPLDDEIEAEHERALRAVDPRTTDRNQRARMAMLAEDEPSTFERGLLLDEFVEEPRHRRLAGPRPPCGRKRSYDP